MGKMNSDNTGKVWETRSFQSEGFLTYFLRSRNPYNSQNMGKVNSSSIGKVWGNTNLKLWLS